MVLVASDTGELSLRDVGPGAVRWRGPIPGMPQKPIPPEPGDDVDEDTYQEWFNETRCTTDHDESLEAWWSSERGFALLRAVFNPPGDECDPEFFYAVVQLD